MATIYMFAVGVLNPSHDNRRMETKGDIREAPALGGFGVPTEALAKLQTDYMAGAVEVWNRILQPAEAPKRPADRRFAASEWAASPANAYLAEMYLLNARTLLGMVESLQADEKTLSLIHISEPTRLLSI